MKYVSMWTFLFVMSLSAYAGSPAQPLTSFTRDIAPLFAKRCVSCHAAQKQNGGLRLDTFELLMKGGGSGLALVAGQSSKSLLFAMLSGPAQGQMPPGPQPLPAADIATIGRWIEAGAKNDPPPLAAKATATLAPASVKEQRPAVNRHIDITIPLQTSVPADLVPTTFFKDVAPVLNANCLGCHSGTKKAGGLSLDSLSSLLMSGGPKGPVVIAGKSNESRLVQRIDGAVKPQMPLPLQAGENTKPLSAAVIDRIKKWINDGAKPGAEGKTTATLEIAAKMGPLPAAAALAFSHDGKLLAEGTFGKVVLWNLATGKVLRTLTEVAGYVHTMEFSPDGRQLAAGGGLPGRAGEVKLYDSSNWTVTQTLAEHRDVVYGLAYNQDGTRLLTASLDKTARLWELATGKAVFTIKDHSDVVNACAFGADGKFYTASADKSVRVFNAETGKSMRTFTGHQLPVIALAVSPDGKAVVSAGEEPALRWWNLNEGTTLRTVGGHSVACHEMKFSKDGALLASAGGDQNVRLWNGANGSSLRTLSGATDWVYSVAISPDKKLIAGGTADGRVLLWDQASGRLLSVLAAHPGKTSGEWLATTPGGYFDASAEMLKLISFRVAGEPAPNGAFLSALHQPEQVMRALKGETVEAPKVVVAK